MAANVTYANLGRNTVIADLAAIAVTVVANSAVYATASGGLPFDLAAVLNTAQPNDSEDIIQPADIIGIQAIQMSTNGFLPGNLTIGTPTQNTAVGSGFGSAPGLPPPMTVRPDYTWATVPCTLRLWGTGSANHAAFAEVADGANTDTVTFLLLYARGGANV